jgi:origin recognition complex subunit 4
MPTTPSQSRQNTRSSSKKNLANASSTVQIQSNKNKDSRNIFDDVEDANTPRRAASAAKRHPLRSSASSPNNANKTTSVLKSQRHTAKTPVRKVLKDTESAGISLDEVVTSKRRSARDSKPTEKVLSARKEVHDNGIPSGGRPSASRKKTRKDEISDTELDEKVDETPTRSKRERKPSAKAAIIEREQNVVRSAKTAKSLDQTLGKKLQLQEEINSPDNELGNTSLQVSRKRGRPPKYALEQDRNHRTAEGSPLKLKGRTPSKRAREDIESPRSAKRRKESGFNDVTPLKLNKRREEEPIDDSNLDELAVDTPTKRKRGRPPKRLISDDDIKPKTAHEERMDIGEDKRSDQPILSVHVEKRPAGPVEAAATTCLTSIVLQKLSGRRRIPLVHLEEEYVKVHNLVESTVTAGEGNSMVIIGARGAGKTALIETVLSNLARSQKDYFHIIKLNGFIQTDDKLALREIWRQLGREMEIDEEAGKSYADTLTMLLALLSHPDEIAGEHLGQVAKSVIFIMDEFDLFATHSRQTLLYNLLDIAQSRKAPIAVIGVTTKFDVKESLEKRVKSRFSHRYVHVSLAKSMVAFQDICMAAVSIQSGELSFEEKALVQRDTTQNEKRNKTTTVSNSLSDWNDAVKASTCHYTYVLEANLSNRPYSKIPNLYLGISVQPTI